VLIRSGVMEFGPLGGFGLKLFSGNGLRLFSRGRGKKGVAGGASVEGAGVGWDCPGALRGLFFRSQMRLGAVRLLASGRTAAAEYFPFRFGSAYKNWGIGVPVFCSFSAGFGSFRNLPINIHLFM